MQMPAIPSAMHDFSTQLIKTRERQILSCTSGIWRQNNREVVMLLANLNIGSSPEI